VAASLRTVKPPPSNLRLCAENPPPIPTPDDCSFVTPPYRNLSQPKGATGRSRSARGAPFASPPVASEVERCFFVHPGEQGPQIFSESVELVPEILHFPLVRRAAVQAACCREGFIKCFLRFRTKG
jgi:hypothetical protein